MKASLVLETINQSSGPITAPKILEKLKQKNIFPNKTTIYRQIDTLLKKNLINEVNLSPHISYYEPSNLKHHHHLVCKNCGQVNEILCTELESPVKKFEQKMEKHGFLVKEHNLEFYGLCQHCH